MFSLAIEDGAAKVNPGLPDLVDWMLATESRIGEALALRWGVNAEGKLLLDLEAGTREVNATVVRVAGRGLIVQRRPKTAAGWWVIAVPGFAAEMLHRRPEPREVEGADRPVFTPRCADGLRDPSNVPGDLRQLLDSFDCERCQRELGGRGESQEPRFHGRTGGALEPGHNADQPCTCPSSVLG